MIPIESSMFFRGGFGFYFLSAHYFHIIQVTICHSAIEAWKNAEAVVIATEWKDLLENDWEEVYKGMNIVFDGRLLVDEEKLGSRLVLSFVFCCF